MYRYSLISQELFIIDILPDPFKWFLSDGISQEKQYFSADYLSCAALKMHPPLSFRAPVLHDRKVEISHTHSKLIKAKRQKHLYPSLKSTEYHYLFILFIRLTANH